MKYLVSSPSSGGDVMAAGLARAIYYILGIIEMLLAFRFVFKILGANPASPFVAFIYNLSQTFVAPFSNIFPKATVRVDVITSTFEPDTLVAIFVYTILAQGLVHLIAFVLRSDRVGTDM